MATMMMAEAVFPTSIDISPATRAQTIVLLNQQLADVLDLSSQTKQAHWNGTGGQFSALRELFEGWLRN